MNGEEAMSEVKHTPVPWRLRTRGNSTGDEQMTELAIGGLLFILYHLVAHCIVWGNK